MARTKSDKTEETQIVTFRLPIRLWTLLKKASKDEHRDVSKQIRKLVEDFLLEKSYIIKDKDQKQ